MELSLEEWALMAPRVAVGKVIGEHACEGLAVYIRRDGKAVTARAEELRAQLQG